MNEAQSPELLTGMHSAGALTVTPEAASFLGVSEVQQSAQTDNKSNQPFVNVHVVHDEVEPHQPGAGKIVKSAKGVSVEVGKGLGVNNDADVRVSVGPIAAQNPHKLVDMLGAALSERLHGKRSRVVAMLGAGAVLGAFMVAGNVLPGAGFAAGAYFGTKLLLKAAGPRSTGSVRPSYDYADRVASGVVGALVNDSRK